MKLLSYETNKDTVCDCGSKEFTKIRGDWIWKCTECGLLWAYCVPHKYNYKKGVESRKSTNTRKRIRSK